MRLNTRCTRFRTLAFEPLESRTLLDAKLTNVILMIGDGMGFEQVEAGRMYLGGHIAFDDLPHQAEMTTHSANSTITDSAAAATAMATGQKVSNGVISTAIPGDGSELTTALEILRDRGKATGLVTTTNITHATPGAFGAHAVSRGHTADIAGDLLGQTRPDVIFGGGGGSMTVAAAAAAGYTVVQDAIGLATLDTLGMSLVSGQFGSGYMPYEYDGLGDLPHLSKMTAAALSVLDNDPDGFFLMVEGGRIDHAGHANDVRRSVRETAEFARSVETVLKWANGRTDTLLIVTADHETGGMQVVADNGPGLAPEVTWSTGGHTGVNVPIYAWGTTSELVTGVLDNTNVFGLVTTTIEYGNAIGPPDPADGVPLGLDVYELSLAPWLIDLSSTFSHSSEETGRAAPDATVDLLIAIGAWGDL
ncbi:MAG: alkaline phosphatase [Candidatus Nealsonbacteria bacterium]|nr:alkaline phosphatase [Candidatus Nealsonbacteria bacterium]